MKKLLFILCALASMKMYAGDPIYVGQEHPTKELVEYQKKRNASLEYDIYRVDCATENHSHGTLVAPPDGYINNVSTNNKLKQNRELLSICPELKDLIQREDELRQEHKQSLVSLRQAQNAPSTERCFWECFLGVACVMTAIAALTTT